MFRKCLRLLAITGTLILERRKIQLPIFGEGKNFDFSSQKVCYTAACLVIIVHGVAVLKRDFSTKKIIRLCPNTCHGIIITCH